MSIMSTTTSGLCIEETARSAQLAADLELARAGRRAVILSGHTSDVFVERQEGKVVRLPEFLAIQAAQQGLELVLLDSRRGARQIVAPGSVAPMATLNAQPAPMLDLLETTLDVMGRRGMPVRLVAEWCCLELAADNGDLLRAFLEVPTSPVLSSGGHQLVLVFRTSDPPRELTVMPGFRSISVGLPDALERKYVMGQSHERSPIPLEEGLEVPGVATMLGGLDNDGLLRTGYEARAGAPLSVRRIADIKAHEIERVAGGTLLVHRGELPNGLAGMAGLRYYLESCLRAEVPLDPILLAGVPGVGKTYSFRWLAQELGLPAVSFGQLKGGIVGETEANFERASRSLKANAPACLLLNEVDQCGLGKRGHNLDAGVSDHLRARILELVNEARERGITVVMATNNPAGMDPAGLDRVVVVPCLHPTTTEAVEIMVLAADREGFQLDSEAAREMLVGRGGLVTGRQLVRLLRRAARHAATAGHAGLIQGDDLRSAAADGLDITNRDAQEYMALSALTLAESQECLPWVAAARLGEPIEVPPYLRALLQADGVLDMQAVHSRVDQLRSSGHGFDV